MLFQAYTGCRPAELVHAPRGRGLEDPLIGEDIHNAKLRPDIEGVAHDDESDYGGDNDDSGYNSATGGDGRDIIDEVMDCDGDFICDSDDDDFNDGDSDRTDDTATEQQTQDPDELRERVREFKALCYEDIRLWVVKDPKRGERDLLAMEVTLRHHKGADNKPKPCVNLSLSLCT